LNSFQWPLFMNLFGLLGDLLAYIDRPVLHTSERQGFYSHCPYIADVYDFLLQFL